MDGSAANAETLSESDRQLLLAVAAAEPMRVYVYRRREPVTGGVRLLKRLDRLARARVVVCTTPLGVAQDILGNAWVEFILTDRGREMVAQLGAPPGYGGGIRRSPPVAKLFVLMGGFGALVVSAATALVNHAL